LEIGSLWKICPTHKTETFAANKFCSTLLFYARLCDIIPIKLHLSVKVIPTYEEQSMIYVYIYIWGKAMANYPQELAQDAVCQGHTGHMTGLWFLPSLAFKAEY